ELKEAPIKQNSPELEEIVVVGYGTSQKAAENKLNIKHGEIIEEVVKNENLELESRSGVTDVGEVTIASTKTPEVSFTAFPNPAKDNIQIKINSTTDEAIKVELFGLDGKRIKRDNLKGIK